MSIKTKIAALALATLAVTGTIASTTQAQAKPLHWGRSRPRRRRHRRHRDRRFRPRLLLRRLSPLRLGSPVRRFRQLHGPRPHLRLLISRLTWFCLRSVFFKQTTSDLKTLLVDLRPARAPHPPPCRTRPARLSPRAGQLFWVTPEPPVAMCQRCLRTPVSDLCERYGDRPTAVAHVTQRCHPTALSAPCCYCELLAIKIEA